MPHLTLPGVDLCYEDTGGSDTPVIFLHAASGITESWVHQLPASTTDPTPSFGGFGVITSKLKPRWDVHLDWR